MTPKPMCEATISFDGGITFVRCCRDPHGVEEPPKARMVDHWNFDKTVLWSDYPDFVKESFHRVQPKAVFNAAVDDVLGECVAICAQRGGEYLDSWHLDNQVTTFVDHTLRLLNISVNKEARRLLIMAALVDVKDSRMQGAFKRDTIVDGINYRAAFGSLMQEYLVKYEYIEKPVPNAGG